VNDFIETTSKVYKIPKDMVTVAVYMAAAVAAGNRITTFDGVYTNKLSLWGITVGISGAGKSQYAYKVFQPILKRNDILIEEDKAEKKKWDRKGEEPVQHDFRMHSATLEAVLKKLSDNPDGIFYFRPELSGWVGSFGKYNRDDTEYSSWIELWDGKTFPIHTKTGETKFINCKDPVLSVFGGVQPHILKRFANKDIVGTGFLGRLLIVFPKLNYPTCPPEETLDDKLLCFWEELIKTIYSTNTQFLFSTEAKEIYNEYCYKYILDKLLVFEGEINSKFDDKKLYLIEKILDELNESNDKIKSECICDSLCLVMSNTPFFNLFITKIDLLEKLYNILFNSKNNTQKINSILKLLTKINENILQRFEVRYTSCTQNNNNDMNLNNAEMCYSNDQDKSITSRGDNLESLKSILFILFDVLEKKKLFIFEDFGNFNQEENSEFKATYMEKQKKIGMKKIMQTAYLQTLLEIIVNSYASKYYENKIEKLMNIAKDMNLFWNLHIIFFLFPFSNIYQIYYNRIIEIVLDEHSPNCLIEAFSMEFNGEKRNIIDFYIEKIIKDMKFNFDLTETKSFNPCFSFAISLLNKIYNSQNIYVKKKIEKNKNLSVFYEIVIKEINNVYTQKLLLNTNFEFGDNEDDKNLNYFGPESLLESFEENCKIYEAYKKGENYQKLLNDKKERLEKDKNAKKKDNEKIENNMGLEYIDDIDDDDDDPLFKVEKINSNKDKDNFFSILNKPRDEINQDNNNNYNKENENIINDDEKDNILNMENINDELGKMNEDSVPNQIENKIYHVDYNEIRKGNRNNQ
jgi:hypothetical protein